MGSVNLAGGFMENLLFSRKRVPTIAAESRLGANRGLFNGRFEALSQLVNQDDPMLNRRRVLKPYQFWSAMAAKGEMCTP